MRRVLPLIPAVLTTLALAGCGSSEPAQPQTATGAARVALGSGVTDGRTGAAVTRDSEGALRELSGGGRSDASDRPRAGRRDAVGAGEACTETDLMPSADNLPQVEAATLCLINGERADRGLAPFTLNGKLARAALGHAEDMVEHSYFAHEGLDGSDLKDRIGATGYIPTNERWVIGENLAWGTGALATPKAIVNAWMNSPGHRANILHADYREIGFGTVVGNPVRADGFGATYANEFGVVGDPRAGAAGSGPDADQDADAEARPVSTKRTSAPSPAANRTLTRKRAATCARASSRRATASSRRARVSRRTIRRRAKACAARAKRASAKRSSRKA